jgi:hypothetical protein
LTIQSEVGIMRLNGSKQMKPHYAKFRNDLLWVAVEGSNSVARFSSTCYLPRVDRFFFAQVTDV